MIDNSDKWYIARSAHGKRSVADLYDRLQNQSVPLELYWPKRIEKKEHGSRIVPILHEFLFIKADIDTLVNIFKDSYIQECGFLMNRIASDGTKHYATVPDREMTSFRWLCDNYFDNIIVIDKDSFLLKDKLKVRVTKGLMKGKCGVLCRHKGNRSFAIRFEELMSDDTTDKSECSNPFFNMTFIVTDVFKRDLEVIGDDKRTEERYTISSLIDSLQTHIRQIKDKHAATPYLYTSGSILASLILNRIYHSPLLTPELIKKFRWISEESHKAQQVSPNGNRRPKEYVLRQEETLFTNLDFINSILSIFSKEQHKALDFIAEYAIANCEQELSSKSIPELSDLVFAGPISPCFTYNTSLNDLSNAEAFIQHDTFMEVTRRVNMSDTIDNYIHIALFPNNDGILAITSWAKCGECFMLDTKSQELAEPIIANTPVEFRSHYGITGTSIFIPQVPLDLSHTLSYKEIEQLSKSIDTSLETLTSVSLSLCNEIWRTPQASSRKYLPLVRIFPPDNKF